MLLHGEQGPQTYTTPTTTLEKNSMLTGQRIDPDTQRSELGGYRKEKKKKICMKMNMDVPSSRECKTIIEDANEIEQIYHEGDENMTL